MERVSHESISASPSPASLSVSRRQLVIIRIDVHPHVSIIVYAACRLRAEYICARAVFRTPIDAIIRVPHSRAGESPRRRAHARIDLRSLQDICRKHGTRAFLQASKKRNSS